MKNALLLAGLATLVACSQEASKQTSNATPEQVARIEAAKPPPEPPKPTHFYSLYEDGEYGYERRLSEDDQKAGKKAQALLMVRYLGVKDGTYTVQQTDGPSREVFSCSDPCEFVKSKYYYASSFLRGETIRATEGSVIWAVLQDAQHGELKPFQLQPKPADEAGAR